VVLVILSPNLKTYMKMHKAMGIGAVKNNEISKCAVVVGNQIKAMLRILKVI